MIEILIYTNQITWSRLSKMAAGTLLPRIVRLPIYILRGQYFNNINSSMPILLPSHNISFTTNQFFEMVD